MRKFLFILSLLCLFPFEGAAQQDPVFSQYGYNYYVINPAYAGSRDALSVIMMNRSRWVGLPGSPRTLSLSAHAPIKDSGISWGVNVAADRIGPSRNLVAGGTGAYTIRMKKSKLAFGLRLGVYNARFNVDALNFKDVTDPYNTGGTQSATRGSADFGVYYYTRRFYASLSLNHINAGEFDLEDFNEANYRLERYNTIGLGYAFDLKPNFTLKPSLLLKSTVGFDPNLDISLMALFYKRVWFGVSVRNQSSMNFMLDVNATDFLRIGYAYDSFFNGLSNAVTGAHEFFIGFDLHNRETKVVSPRYL